MARSTQKPILITPILQSPQSRKIPEPPVVGILPAIIIFCAPEIIAAGLCAGAVICTYMQGEKPITLRCPQLPAGNMDACIRVGITILGHIYIVCKTWAEQFGAQLEAAKASAAAQEAYCNSQWGPTSDLAIIAAASFAAGTISAAVFQQTMDKLAALLKSCVDSAWSLVLRMLQDAVDWTNEQMGGYGRGLWGIGEVPMQ